MPEGVPLLPYRPCKDIWNPLKSQVSEDQKGPTRSAIKESGLKANRLPLPAWQEGPWPSVCAVQSCHLALEV